MLPDTNTNTTMKAACLIIIIITAAKVLAAGCQILAAFIAVQP